jgi:dipicolinate synthase subunit A
LAKEMGFFTVDRIDLRGSEVVFNTVPQRIITNDDLLELEGGRILIELASAPGGFDPDIAKGCSHVVVDGRGLPGKYAPISAGRAVAEFVESFLKMIRA